MVSELVREVGFQSLKIGGMLAYATVLAEILSGERTVATGSMGNTAIIAGVLGLISLVASIPLEAINPISRKEK